MEQEELEFAKACVECGAILNFTDDPVFGYSEELFLCRDCATRRGAEYNSNDGNWTREPDLQGLL